MYILVYVLSIILFHIAIKFLWKTWKKSGKIMEFQNENLVATLIMVFLTFKVIDFYVPDNLGSNWTTNQILLAILYQVAITKFKFISTPLLLYTLDSIWLILWITREYAAATVCTQCAEARVL